MSLYQISNKYKQNYKKHHNFYKKWNKTNYNKISAHKIWNNCKNI